MKKLTAALTAAVAFTGMAAVPAQAEEFRLPIVYTDIDTASENGAAALATRIENRVTRACARANDHRDLRAVPQCRADLLANAVEQLRDQGEEQVAATLAPRA